MRWLVLKLHAPMGAFGEESIDARGPTAWAPGASLLTGLLGNALGWTRSMGTELQALQDRLIHGSVWETDKPEVLMTDFQTAELHKDDRAWTTSGHPAGRRGGIATYEGPHLRWRDYLPDLRVTVVLRLADPDARPTLEELADALRHPARPLYIGRKSCLPTRPIFGGWIEDTILAHGALMAAAPAGRWALPAAWPVDEGPAGDRVRNTADTRNWVSGLHGGSRRIVEGTITTGREERPT